MNAGAFVCAPVCVCVRARVRGYVCECAFLCACKLSRVRECLRISAMYACVRMRVPLLNTGLSLDNFAFMEVSVLIHRNLCYLSGNIDSSYAVYCRYRTHDGKQEFTYCMEKCCQGKNLSYSNVCCR